MDVLTFETRCAVNSEIIKQVTSSWSIFIQLLSGVQDFAKRTIYLVRILKTLIILGYQVDKQFLALQCLAFI